MIWGSRDEFAQCADHLKSQGAAVTFTPVDPDLVAAFSKAGGRLVFVDAGLYAVHFVGERGPKTWVQRHIDPTADMENGTHWTADGMDQRCHGPREAAAAWARAIDRI